MNYFLKNFNLSFFDLVLVAIVGGLLVNFFTFIFSKVFELISRFYIENIKEPFQNKRKEKQYWKRVKSKSITDIDLMKIGKKKREGTVTEEEKVAASHREKQMWDNLSDERKEEIKKQEERIKRSFKQWKL